MAVAPTEFFATLGGSAYEPLLHGATGSVRFDLVDERDVEHWLVTIERGSVSASKRNRRADCVVRVGRSLFERIADGEANAMAAILRGEMTLEGDAQLAVLFQRLFPSPPAARARIRRGGATSP